MNLSSILQEIEQQDPEVYERLSPRRAVIKNWSRRLALTAVPFALGSLFKKAYGKGNAAVTEVLNQALMLEFLEREFYAQGLSATNLIPALQRGDIQLLHDNEASHVSFLDNTIRSLGGTPVPAPNFDFTGGKGGTVPPTFGSVFTNYETFLGLAQAFEDTGVRAYKGAAPDLAGDDNVLTQALRIHSVEARHAAKVRYMRMLNGYGSADLRPWVTLDQSGGLPLAAAPVYKGEEVTTQLDIQIPGINSQAVSANAASQAFDEPLPLEDVKTIAELFIVP